MSPPNVVFDADNGELRNNVTFFGDFESQPFDILWQEGLSGKRIVPGMVLGSFVWPGQPETVRLIVAPPGCQGRVLSEPDQVEYNRLDQEPSQVLLQLEVVTVALSQTA